MYDNKQVIGYVTPANPFTDRKHWSGLTYKIREGIERAGYKVVWIPYPTVGFLIRCWNLIIKLYSKMRFPGQRYLLGENFVPTAKILARSIKKCPSINECDCLFFPGGGQLGLYLQTNIPIIYYSGATVKSMIGYYWHDICKRSQKIAVDIDKRASLSATINIKASDWAINSINNDYGCPANRSFVLEYGPAIDTKDITIKDAYKGGKLKVLFSGVDWERKNGDIAVAVVSKLRDKGIDASLVVAGIRQLPEYCSRLEYVESVGFLNKNTPDGYNKYISLFKECDILFVPTKAECAGVVFCEASAFGLPSYTFATGGTPNYVVDGKNGRTIQISDSAGDTFAQLIYDDIKSGKLSEMRDGALAHSREKLSWEAWSERFKKIMKSCFAED
ncbi:MAG: glycosyltransferase family 4 protein [Bacteroidaceae bacterium]|nr:glycosyltransferase family 4 protein [Bacteroidaceae bacterium]